MADHARRQYRMRDPDLERLLKAHWNSLPAKLRESSQNISAIRVGVVAYAVLIVMYVAQTAASTDPEGFTSRMLSLHMFLTMLGLVAAVGILVARAVTLAPHFVDAYAQMLPDHEADIRSLYAERGTGDLIAPWIKGKPGRFTRLFRALARRFSIIP